MYGFFCQIQNIKGTNWLQLSIFWYKVGVQCNEKWETIWLSITIDIWEKPFDFSGRETICSFLFYEF